MISPENFRPSAIAAFEPGALGEDAAPCRATITRRYRLSSGTPIIHAAPESEAPHARVVILPSLRGHNAMFAELCTRLAELHGYEIVSPELFPDGQQLTEAERIARCRTMDDGRVLRDVRLAAEKLHDGPVVVVGFCLGGMYACKATAEAAIVGAVSFYGFVRLPQDWQRSGREEPIDSIRRASVPVLGLFGRKDPLIPHTDTAAFQSEPNTRIVVFDEAGHAFAHDPLLPSYRVHDARRAWQVACAFIDEVNAAHD